MLQLYFKFISNLNSLRSLRYCFVPREHKLELSKWIYLDSLAKQIEIVNQLWVQTAPQKKPKKKQVLQLRNCTEFPQNVYILLDSCKCLCVWVCWCVICSMPANCGYFWGQFVMHLMGRHVPAPDDTPAGAHPNPRIPSPNFWPQ